MKKITAILALLLFAIASQAQVKINFNGFHCHQETSDGSGSDEIYFIFNIFKDGMYFKTIKYPENSYIGGVDAGGTYGKGNFTIYEGPSANIMMEVHMYEWDNDNPNDNIGYFNDFYSKKKTCDEVNNKSYYNNPLTNFKFNWKTFEKMPYCDYVIKDASIRGKLSQDDHIGLNILAFGKFFLDKTIVNELPFSIITSNSEIDNYPYNIKVPEISNYYGNNADGRFSAFFSVVNNVPELNNKELRKYWNDNPWIGKFEKLLNKNSATFENATLYLNKKNIVVSIQGAIREKYRQKGVFEKVGNLESNEMDVTDQKWKDAGYLKFNKFSKGYIVWKPSSCLALTNEEFDAGPKSFAEIVTEVKTKEPAKKIDLSHLKNAKSGEDNRETAIAMITNYMATNQYAKDNLGDLKNDQGHPKQTTNKDGKTGWFWATTKNNGFIFYTPFNNQVHFVDLGFRSIHAKNNTEHGVYGFPISDPFGIKDNGVVQQFEFGNMYYRPQSDWKNELLFGTYGKINEKYGSQGWENGNLGYPVNNEYSCPIKGAKKGQYYAEVGHAQFFEGGAIWYKLKVKKAVIVHHGPIMERFNKTGWEVGELEYPEFDAVETNDKKGLQQQFEKGYIYWKKGEAEAYSVKYKNGIFNIFLQNYDKLGFPISEEKNTEGTISQTFENGTIVGDKVIMR